MKNPREKYKERRQSLGSQSEVGARVGASADTISDRECGRQQVRAEHFLALEALEKGLSESKIGRERYMAMRKEMGNRPQIAAQLGISFTTLADREMRGRGKLSVGMILAMRELRRRHREKLSVRRTFAGRRKQFESGSTGWKSLGL